MDNFIFDSPVICLKNFEPHEIIIAGTYKEAILLNYKFEVLDRISIGSPVRTAVCKADGTVYIGLSSMTQNPLITIDSTGKLTEVNYEDERQLKSNFMIMDMCLDSEENLWIASAGSSLLKLKNNSLIDYNANNSDVNDSTILSVFPDTTGQGKVWFGTQEAGFGILGMIDWNEKRGRYALGPDMMQMMLPEYEFKRYWITQHLSIGAPYTCGQVWDSSNYEERYEEILRNNIQEEEEFYDYDEKEETKHISLFSNKVKCIAIDNEQRVWLGTINSGIIKFKWNTESVIYHSENSNLPDNDIYTLTTDNKNRAFAGTDRGLVLIDDTIIKVYNTDNSFIKCNEIRSLLVLNNFLLIGFNAQSYNNFAYKGSNNYSLQVISLNELDSCGEIVSQKE